MGFWLAQPRLEKDETIRWQSPAGRSLSRWITSGGRLIVTNRRVLFQPNRFDKLTGKTRWDCPLSSVTEFEVVDRDPTVLAGGLRKRLRIQTQDDHEIFILNHLDERIAELREFIPQQA